MPPVWMLVAMLLFIAAMGFDGVNAFLYDLQFYAGLEMIPHLYVPRLDLRAITGLLTGIAFAAILLPIANHYLWRADDPRPLFANAKHFLGALAVAAIFFLFQATEVGVFYYPIAILSAASVLILLTLINAVFILSFTNRAGYATTWRDALNPLAFATAATIAELALLSLLRYTVLGTATLP